MNLRHFLIRLFLTTMATFAPIGVMAQTTLTKSGTPVTPAESHSVGKSIFSKSFSPLSCPTAGTYLVVTTPDLLPQLQPLLRWKKQQGFNVETICTNTNKRDTIRNLLLSRYEASTPLRPAQNYVLLVGDVDRIQAFIGQHTPNGLGNTITDLYYGEYTGDYIPEAMVGRLSVTDSAELVQMVKKIIDYEQGRWAEDYADILFAAGKELRSPAPTTTNGQVNYLSQLFANYRPEMDTLCFRNNAEENPADSIVQALLQPNALVNYTSHCTRAGWDFPNINFLTIDTLDNHLPSIYINNCCLSNAFDGTCFGEELLRKADGGAAGVIGATNESLWYEDYYWAVGAKMPASEHPDFDFEHAGAFDDLATMGSDIQMTGFSDVPDLGTMLHKGCHAVGQAGSVYEAYYWELYSLLGDPSMIPWMGRFDTLPTFDSVVCSLAETSLKLRSAPYARISVTQDTTLLGTAVADAYGVANITLAHSLVGDSVTLTASRPEARFRQQTLPLAVPSQGKLAVVDYSLSDTLLHIHLRNVGSTIVRHHRLCLTQDSSDLSGTAIHPIAPCAIDCLPKNSDTLVTLNLGHLGLGMEPILALQLHITDSLDSCYTLLPIQLELPDLRPQLVAVRILDTDSIAATDLHTGQSYQLELTLSHTADSVVSEQRLLICQNEVWRGTFVPTDSAFYHLVFTVFKDGFKKEYSYWMPLFRATERFETGNFDNFPWQSNSRWTIDSTHSHEGVFCARSAAIDHNQKTVLCMDVDVLTNDSISFWYSVSSEADDRLYFFIDGMRRGYWSGNGEWGRKSCSITAGHHHLEWVYQKDASVSERGDCAHIDDIVFPLCLWNKQSGIPEESTLLSSPQEPYGIRFSVYPNPTCGTITLICSPCPYHRQIEVYDPLGRLADKIFMPANATSTQYSTTHLRFGIYTLLLRDKKHNALQKLIINN